MIKRQFLQSKYLYVRSERGFYLIGLSGESLPILKGFYRFSIVDLSENLSSNYIDIEFEDDDSSFFSWTSNVYLDNVDT